MRTPVVLGSSNKRPPAQKHGEAPWDLGPVGYFGYFSIGTLVLVLGASLGRVLARVLVLVLVRINGNTGRSRIGGDRHPGWGSRWLLGRVCCCGRFWLGFWLGGGSIRKVPEAAAVDLDGVVWVGYGRLAFELLPLFYCVESLGQLAQDPGGMWPQGLRNACVQGAGGSQGDPPAEVGRIHDAESFLGVIVLGADRKQSCSCPTCLQEGEVWGCKKR
ncbi:hypothetical protein BT67DRAFT_134297, partial [Trichocladium antarcticum]